LAVDALVMTTDGRAVPVAWLGRQTISMRFADPLWVLPIRIKAGALDEGVPSRDLLLSPDHAVLVGEILIQAGALVNGFSIVREAKVPHIRHSPTSMSSLTITRREYTAETFIDNVDRLAFDNWEEHVTLYPEGNAIVEMPYPRAKAYRQVPRSLRARGSTSAALLCMERGLPPPPDAAAHDRSKIMGSGRGECGRRVHPFSLRGCGSLDTGFDTPASAKVAACASHARRRNALLDATTLRH
jgi:hypothetical protein